LVDSQGLLLDVIVTEANGSERIGGLTLVMEYTQDHQNLELIWVDQGYQGERFVGGVKHLCQASVEVIKRKSKGFEVLARRWVVERTFAWLVKNRRLVVDYEKHPEISETLIYIAMVRLMLKRLANSSVAIAS
jgi:putative transposase